MKVLIIEDEPLAARRLQLLLSEYDSEIEVLAILDSIEDAVSWLSINAYPVLIFMDIMLADGQSFEIFDQVEIPVPVIFTTAYDEFAIRAFKVNSIDYLLKPVDPLLLAGALKKYSLSGFNVKNINQIVSKLLSAEPSDKTEKHKFKSRFLVKSGSRLLSVLTEEAAYFCFEDRLTFLITRLGKRHLIDLTLDELEQVLDPHFFFRLNRQFIASFASIKSVHVYFNGKLKIYLEPDIPSGIISSRERAQNLKLWLDR